MTIDSDKDGSVFCMKLMQMCCQSRVAMLKSTVIDYKNMEFHLLLHDTFHSTNNQFIRCERGCPFYTLTFLPVVKLRNSY